MRFAWFLLAAMTMACPVVGSAGPVKPTDPPPSGKTLPAASTGDILFRLDAASFAGDAGMNRLELYFAIPNNQLHFDERDGSFHGKVAVRARVTDSGGSDVARLTDEVALTAGTMKSAGDRSVIQIVTEKLAVPPGDYRLVAEVEDLTMVKQQLLAQIRGDHPEGEVDVSLTAPAFVPSPVALSELQFGRLAATAVTASSHEGEAADASLRGMELVPNPARLYGLLLPEVVAFVEVYPASGAEADSSGEWSTVYRILGAGGQEVLSDRKTGVQHSSSAWGKTVRIDASNIPAGEYVLAVEITDAEGRILASRRGAFQVVWSPYSWGRETEEILGEMEPILTAKEFARLKNMNRGDAETFLTKYWHDRDPTPDTPVNEVMQEHFRRISYAHNHYPEQGRAGGLEDRGRIYVRYGEPDDLEEGFDDAFYTKPQDTHEARSQTTPPGSPSPAGDASTDRLLDMKSREGVLRALGDEKAEGKRWEVWYYDSRGTQLTRDTSGVRRTPRMRFVFMDQYGTGQYTLVYSSEPGDF